MQKLVERLYTFMGSDNKKEGKKIMHVEVSIRTHKIIFSTDIFIIVVVWICFYFCLRRLFGEVS